MLDSKLIKHIIRNPMFDIIGSDRAYKTYITYLFLTNPNHKSLVFVAAFWMHSILLIDIQSRPVVRERG